MARRDLPDKLAGRPLYVQDMALPGMLYVRAVNGVVAVARDGRFIAVLAEREEAARKGAKKKLAATILG